MNSRFSLKAAMFSTSIIEDDDRSMIVNVGSGSESDDSTQHSDSSPSGDGECLELCPVTAS